LPPLASLAVGGKLQEYISNQKGRAAGKIFNNITDMAKEKDQEFLEYIVKELVDNPKEVKVDRKVDEMGVLLSLTVNPQDMGQIIGREGSTAKAIRNLVRIVGLKNHARVNLKIEEPEGGRAPRMEKKEMTEDIENISL